MNKFFLTLIILVLIFLGINCWLVWRQPSAVSLKFDWPDETANYFWMIRFAENNQLSAAEPFNLLAQNAIHPRSFNVTNQGDLVPATFLGFILFYGVLAKIFTANAVIYFTPILASLAVLAWYGLLRRIFNEKIAFLSAILLLFNPAWWYYSVTSLLPNVAFVALVIISVFFLFYSKQNKQAWLWWLLGGLIAGLALSLRPAELVWLAIVYAGVLIYLWQELNWRKILLFLAPAVLAVLPSLYYQEFLYGNWLTVGYQQLASEGTRPSANLLASFFLPFGFHPRLAWHNLWWYGLKLFWWLSLPAAAGALIFLAKIKEQKILQKGYLLIALLISFFLIIYYGSWLFSDLLTVKLNTIGLSYVRYWLPLFIIWLPFGGGGILAIVKFLNRRLGYLLIFLILGLLFIKSADLTLWAKADSLLPVKRRMAVYQQTAEAVFNLTEANSLIVTSRKDKLFFPERKVTHTFQPLFKNQEMVARLEPLIGQLPIYYYALGKEPKELNDHLGLELVKSFSPEVLYRVVAIN